MVAVGTSNPRLSEAEGACSCEMTTGGVADVRTPPRSEDVWNDGDSAKAVGTRRPGEEEEGEELYEMTVEVVAMRTARSEGDDDDNDDDDDS